MQRASCPPAPQPARLLAHPLPTHPPPPLPAQVLRFAPAGLPRAFYADFARIADEESRHLSWCLQRLRELGHAYGCMPAHNLVRWGRGWRWVWLAW